MNNLSTQKKIALLSVYHKDGIVDFAKALIELDWRIISSGGTANHLQQAGVSVEDIAEITGLSAILEHRVVTLHPAIHGGLLAEEHMLEELTKLGFPWIDLVCGDLYPLKDAIAKQGATRDSVIAATDIGGPTMLRSGAKGRRIVVADPSDRQVVVDWLRAGQPERDAMIDYLAAKTEGIIADYCLTSARYHSKATIDGMVGTLTNTCKYGENGWQQEAGLYTVDSDDPLSIANFQLKNERVPGYVNYCDVDRVLQTIIHIAAAFDVNMSKVPYIAIAVKHGNACGASIGKSHIEALQGMIDGDRLAIFGGVVMTNFPINEPELDCLRSYNVKGDGKRFLAGIIASEITDTATITLKRSNCFLMENPALNSLSRESLDTKPIRRQVRGGFLMQTAHAFVMNFSDMSFTFTTALSDIQKIDLLIAWAIGSTSTSNTISLVKNHILIGNGTGQQDRVMAAELAVDKAIRGGHDIANATAYSDSFFPFPDGTKVLTDAGVSLIFASSGSKGDAAVKAHCRDTEVNLCMMPDSQCRGFYGH